jgi:hypothetical protein
MSDSPLCPYCQSNLLPVWWAIESGVLCSRSEQIAAWLLDSSTLADRKQMFRDRRLEETTTPEERTVYCPVGRERRGRAPALPAMRSFGHQAVKQRSRHLR